MRFLSSLHARIARLALAGVMAFLVAAPALAVTDRRAVDGATNDVAPVVPEPSSILLFLIGVGIVGYGVHRRRSS